jgi:hypothetical protein
MSFMDKLKSLFSGGSEGSSTTHEPAAMPAEAREAEAPMDMPAAPMDPLGTPMPGNEPATLPPPGGTETENERTGDERDDAV